MRALSNAPSRFAKDFIHWFAPDGSALPYGRSLAYRFGQAAFWSAYVFAGCKGISLGVVKGILSRHLEWWSAQQITDRDGVLTVGYAYPNLIMQSATTRPLAVLGHEDAAVPCAAGRSSVLGGRTLNPCRSWRRCIPSCARTC